MAENETKTALASWFIADRGPAFHSALEETPYFGVAISRRPSSKTLTPESDDLAETLKQYQTDHDFDLLRCTWDDVFRELEAAKVAASKSETRGKTISRRVWRWMGKNADIVTPSLAAIPDKVCVLQGGLALIFGVSITS